MREDILSDPDERSDLLDDLAYALEAEPILEDPDPKKVRFQLYKQYEGEHKCKKSVWQGRETQGFKNWLTEQQKKFDVK